MAVQAVGAFSKSSNTGSCGAFGKSSVGVQAVVEHSVAVHAFSKSSVAVHSGACARRFKSGAHGEDGAVTRPF